MQRITNTALLLLIITVCHAQPQESVIINENVIGKNLINNQDIKATEYIFKEKIFQIHVDSLSQKFTVQIGAAISTSVVNKVASVGMLRDRSAEILMYDVNKRKTLWTKQTVNNVIHFEQFGNLLIQSSQGKCFSVDIETGEQQWDLKNTIVFADMGRGIGAGYRAIGRAKHKEVLEGTNLADGTVKWERNIPLKSGWEQSYPLNDSVLLIVSGGLHAVNLKDGSGWDYKFKTWHQDPTGSVTATGISSNILTDDNRIYMAGTSKLACLDFEGKEIWVNNLKTDYSSTSVLHKKDGILYLINKGTAMIEFYTFNQSLGSNVLYINKPASTTERHEANHGRPFIAAYDINTGKELFFQDFNYKKNHINDFQVDKHNIYLLFEDRIARYSVADNKITEKIFDKDTVGKLEYFVGPSAYLPTKAGYQSLSVSDVTRQYFLTNKSKVFILDNMGIIAHAELKNLYHLYHTSQRHQFIQKDGETILLDNYGRSLAKLKMSERSFLRGKTLYDVQDNRIIEVNLEELLID